MNIQKKGFVRGIIYPVFAFIAHAVLVSLIHSGWFSASGAIILTGLLAYVDHTPYIPEEAPIIETIDP